MKKLGNRGQVLILFVIMFPIMFALIAFFLENMFITGEKNKLNNLNEILISYIVENRNNVGVYDGVLELLVENDSDVVIRKFEVSDESASLILYKEVDSFFGKIVGIEKYDVNSSYVADINGDKIIYDRN